MPRPLVPVRLLRTFAPRPSRGRAPLVLAALLATACAHAARTATGAPAGDRNVVFKEPLVIRPSPAEEQELVGKNDEELFAIGTAAYSGGDYKRAALAFARLADVFPESKHYPAALFNAGLSFEHLEEWRLALERFRALARNYTGPDADDAQFKAAECLYRLHELEDAIAILAELAQRADLEPIDHVKALTQLGICQLEVGQLDVAEKSLRLAMSAWDSAQESARLDDYFAGQAQFYLGEVYRAYYAQVKLDPANSDEKKLGQDLEFKAELLLSAQGHYLRAIRVGNANWAIAAGYRIGELYDDLYRQLVDAPLPKGLSDEEQAAYREELRKKVRVLVTKAITIYERTLATAQRVGVEDNKFIEKTQASLDRMKQVLLADAKAADAAPADAKVPADADPEKPDPKALPPAPPPGKPEGK